MSEIIDKLRSNPYNEVDKHNFTCPVCSGELYSAYNNMNMVYDGNTVLHCDSNIEKVN